MMNMRNRIAAVSTAGALAFGGMTGVAAAAPPERAVTQSGGAAGLVAAVVQANIQNVDVTVVDGDVNVTLENILNNNRILNDSLNNNQILSNFLNDNDIDINDVVDVTIVDNVLVLNVLSTSNIAGLA